MKQFNVQLTDTLTPLPDSMTVCATIDEAGTEHEITELMIRRACEQMDADQLWPFASSALDGEMNSELASELGCKLITAKGTGKCQRSRMRSLPVGGAEIIPFPKRPN